ncbi:MAG: glycine--tRNA ligase [Candidatus Nealsonbacteria bacterium]|nr:glycine--tRNA ligase [Candidatus Nealsonbacteria bacterium]
MNQITSLCKRRGFVFPSSEIYSGFGSCYDFGPLGVELKNNIKKAWWKEMLQNQEDVVGLDASILMSAKVWQASGHLTAGFADELVDCKKCHHRFRKDFLEKNKCPDCGGELTEARKFNLMMKTFVGPVEDEAAQTYLRAETCQGIYVNFLNVLNSSRQKIPFGIAQIGKAFRNEITPGNFIFRMREFEQMEMQWFCEPKQADKFFDFWKEQRIKWYLGLGIKKENIRAIEVPEKERAHYAKKQIDIEYKFAFGWKEIEGIHNRGDWDLSNHAKHSRQDLRYFDEAAKEKYFPHIIETSVGVERSFLAFLCEAYQEVEGGRTKTTKSKKEKEIVLKLHQDLAPIKIIVLPLVKNKLKIVKKAREVWQLLKPWFVCQYDDAGSIGRRYRRGDEIGVLYAITIDFETLEQEDVTIRDRDTMKQERIKIKELIEFLKSKSVMGDSRLSG